MTANFADALYPSTELVADPYPFYRWLREKAPVYRVPTRDEYLISRHADVIEVLAHPERFSSEFPRQPEKVGRPLDVLESDPPRHREQKSLAMTGLKPGLIRGHRDAITAIVDGLIDNFSDRGRVALVSDFAARLPVLVFAELFDVPADELWEIHNSTTYLGPARRYIAEQARDADITRAFDMYDYLGQQVRARVDQPGDDVISMMLRHQAATDEVADAAYVQAEIDILFIGGLTTTPHLLVNAMMLLLKHPAVDQSVRADHSLIPRLLDETMRIDSPVQWQPRIAVEDTMIAGQSIPAGSRVLVILASANRDDAVFDDPDRFDITRSNLKDHVGLGHGVHFCLGAPLARMEVQIALEHLLDRLPNLRLSDDNDYAPYPGLSSHSLAELNLEFDAA